MVEPEGKETLIGQIAELVRRYHQLNSSRTGRGEFVPGKTLVPCSGKLFGPEELISGVNSVLDGWWTDGKYCQQFSDKLSSYIGGNNQTVLVNSGSSALLVGITSLFSPLLKERRLKPGDEIITAATCFPTTVNPIIQNGAVPVFVDTEIGNYNPSVDQIEAALSPKTKAIVLAHTLGNPAELDKLRQLCNKHQLYLIEDCCDALGSFYNNKHVGNFGEIGTLSFYPAHHITTGEGGASFTKDPVLFRAMVSLRDWGRDCYCKTGFDNTCNARYSQKHGELPAGYDHKYVYSHLGYNLKLTEMQAAIGLAQLGKVDKFRKARKINFGEYYSFFKDYENLFYLPKSLPKANPSWFGFLLTIKEDSGLSRLELLRYLEQKRIGTRLLFAGNITRQPYMLDLRGHYKIAGSLKNTDKIMQNTFWIGVQPNLTEGMREYVKQVFREYLVKRAAGL